MALTQTQVSELYVSIFNRASEGEGNTYWQTAKADVVATATDMLNTQVAKDYFGTSLDTDQAFIEHIYLNTLSKTYSDDKDGIDYWVSQLASGKSRGQVVVDLIVAAKDPANASDAQEQFQNRVEVSNFMAETVEHIEATKEGIDATSFGSGLTVTAQNSTVDDAHEAIKGMATGLQFVMTTEVDNAEDFIGTSASETIIGESSTIGPKDDILDTSTTDHDIMNLTLTADMPAFKVSNVEEINVTLKTMGGTDIKAKNISGATITVAADPSQIGFTGAATISDLGDNGAVAGAGITALTVDGVKTGLIDTGAATTLTANVATVADDSLNLKVNGDVALTSAGYKDLNVEATADSVLDISAGAFSGEGTITGEKDLTLKTAAAGISTKKVVNDGTGDLTIELTDNADVDLSKVDSAKLITDITYTNNVTVKNSIDITAKATANTMTVTGPTTVADGGSEGIHADIHLTKAGTLATDAYTFVNIDKASIEAQEGGGIAAITAGTANLTLSTAKNLSVTNIDAAGQSILIDSSSEGKIVFTDVDAAAIVATGFTKDFTMTETTGVANQITVLGGTAKNSITLATTTAAATVVTQDDKDIIVAANTTGDLTINAAGGDDIVSAIAMTTSKAKIDLGDGKDTATVANADTGDLTLTGLAGVDTVTVNAASAGAMTMSLGADNDVVDMTGKLANTASVTINGEAGNDLVKINAATADTSTIKIDGGDGTDIVEVTKDADFTGTTLNLTTIENLKIDETATFSDDQLNGQTFKVSSGTANVDVLTVKLDASVATDSENNTDLSTLDFSASSATEVEYIKIDATGSLSSDVIKAAHNATNVIDITDADGTAINPVNNTIQLFADSMGSTIDNLQTGATQPDVTTAMLTGLDVATGSAKTQFDVAVISGFQSHKVDGDNKVISDDSLILGDAATGTNYKAIAADDAFNGTGKPDIGIEEYLANALEDANTQLAADANLEYIYVYDGNTTTDNPISKDAWLMWDSDGNHSVDAAILLVGVEPATPDGTGFAASDIIAG